MAKLTKREIAALERHVAGLNKLIAGVRSRIPDAQFYLESEDLHIMQGAPHDHDGNSRQHAILGSARVDHCDGGAW